MGQAGFPAPPGEAGWDGATSGTSVLLRVRVEGERQGCPGWLYASDRGSNLPRANPLYLYGVAALRGRWEETGHEGRPGRPDEGLRDGRGRPPTDAAATRAGPARRPGLPLLHPRPAAPLRPRLQSDDARHHAVAGRADRRGRRLHPERRDDPGLA